MVPAAGQAGDAPGRDAVSETPEKKPKLISEQPCHSAGQRQQGCLLPCTMPRSYRPCLTCGGASQGPAPTPLAAGPPAAGCGRAHASAGAEMGASERDLVQQGTRGKQRHANYIPLGDNTTTITCCTLARCRAAARCAPKRRLRLGCPPCWRASSAAAKLDTACPRAGRSSPCASPAPRSRDACRLRRTSVADAARRIAAMAAR